MTRGTLGGHVASTSGRPPARLDPSWSNVRGPASAPAIALDGRSALKDQRNGRIDAVAIANLGCGPGDLDRLANRRRGRLGLGHTHGDLTAGERADPAG